MAIAIRPADVDQQVCEALGLNPRMVRRIILDLEAGQPVKAYVEMYASKRILALDWLQSLEGAEISVLDRE